MASASSSIKTGARRIIYLDAAYFKVRLNRQTTKYTLSRRIMRLVPVLILEDADELSVQAHYPSRRVMRPLE